MFGDGHAYPIYMQLKQAKENTCSSDNGYEHEES
jgi:hypothetical protein